MKTKQIKDLFKVSAKGHIRDITINGVSLLEYFKDIYDSISEFLDFNELIKIHINNRRFNFLELFYKKLLFFKGDIEVKTNKEIGEYYPFHVISYYLKKRNVNKDGAEELGEILQLIKNHLEEYIFDINIENEQEIYMNTEKGVIRFKLFLYTVVVN